MKKLLTLFISALMAVGADAQILIDWEEYTSGYSCQNEFGNIQDYSLSSTSDGIVITISPQTGYAKIWVLGNATLEANHNYIVRITAKFPCDGVLDIGLGNWGNEQFSTANVVTTGDFQVVEVEFSDYAYSSNNGGYVSIYYSDFIGTTIVKRVELIDEETPEPYDPSDICYNYIDKGKVAEVVSNPNKKYKGIVDIPSKVIHEGIEYTVVGIGDYAFSDCRTLTSVTIPNSVTSIGEWAFRNCYSLTSVTIPNSVTSISTGAFAYCKSLTSITIPTSVISMGNCAFEYCLSLTSITIPNSVTSIGNYIFAYCSTLTTINIPNSVTSIGNYAFEYCRSLISITIPNSVRSIDYYAFSNCTGLTYVNIPNSANSMTSIGSNAFEQCKSLTSITIPNSVSNIGNEAFYGCNALTSVTISGGTSISTKAFANCEELADVYCLAENVPHASSNAFDGSYPEYINLHVPEASINLYKTTAPWSQFGNIESLSGNTPELPKCARPTIAIENNKLTFSSETEGALFHYDITCADMKSGEASSVSLDQTYQISVYAYKEGYLNSDVTTMDLPLRCNGDMNNDGKVTITDVVNLIDAILTNP